MLEVMMRCWRLATISLGLGSHREIWGAGQNEGQPQLNASLLRGTTAHHTFRPDHLHGGGTESECW